MQGVPIITLTTLLPLAGAAAVFAWGRAGARARVMAMSVALLCLGGVLAMAWAMDPAQGGLQLQERHRWIQLLNVDYRVGVDGISLLFLLLTALVVPMAILASWQQLEKASLYYGLVLLLEAGLIGTFTARNFFHWFLYWELSLVPAFFLVKLRGGPERSAAASQFFIYTMAGSVGLLLAFLALYWSTGTFDFGELSQAGRNGSLAAAVDQLGWRHLTSRQVQAVLFGLAFFGFAVKIPIVPFHTWLPPVYTQSATSTAMLLTGVMSKMGVYGLVRILLPIFPVQMHWMQKPLLALAVITIVYSAGAALAQREIKRILAYSSINHLGYCVLAVAAVVSVSSLGPNPAQQKITALGGTLLQVFSHGITAALLFWFAGLLEERSGGWRTLEAFGGLRKTAPVLCGLMGIALFASLGLPGLSGFPGEFLIFKGAFALAPVATLLAVPGLLLTAVFLLALLQQVFFGPLKTEWAGFADLDRRERWILAPALGIVFLTGIYPQLVLGPATSAVMNLVSQIGF